MREIELSNEFRVVTNTVLKHTKSLHRGLSVRFMHNKIDFFPSFISF